MLIPYSVHENGSEASRRTDSCFIGEASITDLGLSLSID